MRYQKPRKDRERLYAGVLERIKEKIEHLAIQHDCSKSFVTNTLLAEVLNIKIDERYYDYSTSNRKVRKSA